jgi:Tol biopolymer transport system component
MFAERRTGKPAERGEAMRRLLVLLSVTGMVVLGQAGAGHAAYPGVNGRIAFDRCDDNGCPVFYTMNPDGSDVQQLGDGGHPDWSPDGQSIAFDLCDDNGCNIYTMSADGTGVQQVTHGGFNFDPSYSPDGSLLVFEHFPKGTCCGNIWTIHPDGSGLSQVTKFHCNPQTCADFTPLEPEFSPDGRSIAFWEFDANGNPDHSAIYVMHADGTGLSQVTPLEQDADHPEWSPDGSLIIYNEFSRGLGDICTIRPDGTGFTQLTNVTRQGRARFRPDYSPDGRSIVFVQSAHDEFTIWTMRPDGTGAVQIGEGGDPDWGPMP